MDQPPESPSSTSELDTSSPERLQRAARELGTTVDALEAAVAAVGPRVDRVKDFLTGGNAGRQQDG